MQVTRVIRIHSGYWFGYLITAAGIERVRVRPNMASMRRTQHTDIVLLHLACLRFHVVTGPCMCPLILGSCGRLDAHDY